MSMAHAIVRAVYGGCERGETDAEILRSIASWMDRIDDVADAYMVVNDSDHRAERTMQEDLRRIADKLND